jgi:hypothetical protein
MALSCFALVAVCVSCGGGSNDAAQDAMLTTSRQAAEPADSTALVGEWERETTCAEMLAAFTKAGLRAFAVENILGNAFVPGVASEYSLDDPRHPCKGAVPRKHSHFFTESGEFGSRDWRGEQVDDGTYRVIDDHTLVISKEFPDVKFRYRIEGETITFDPLLETDGCTEFRCIWAVSMAYPGEKWTRVE